MCGIAGYAGFDDAALLRTMCSRLLHRGPDEDGHYTDSGIGLAMRRLSIIDLKTGTQPIANETRDVWVVFNGEIYNYQDLRARLAAQGHVLATSSDTETIVHLYEEHGLDFVQHLRGMFGIALWDAQRRRLVLVRDRVGEKPLFYSWDGRRLLFGSEIKAILPGLGTRSVNPRALREFLAAGYVAGADSFYAEIARLPPGHLLVWEQGQVRVQRYWRHDPAATLSIGYQEARQRLESELTDTIRLCLKSDVEVGAFLSGGIDSSVICALMRRQAAQVQTFSVGYRGEATGFNELSHARRVAEHLGTQHHELILEASSSMHLLPRIIWHYDEPHGEPTSILVYLLCEFVQQRLKVALGGTGGDELFYGYPRHVGLRYLEYYRWLPRWLRRQVIERVLAGIPESTRGSRLGKRINRFVAGAGDSAGEAYLSWVSLFSAEVRSQLVAEARRAPAGESNGEAFLRAHLLEETRTADIYRRATALDLEGYLAEYQLAYMDRMSMAHSLEVRSPLCDYRLLEYVTALPTAYRLRGTRTKHILKDVARQWIPDEIINRRKVGFDSPIGQWFKGELREFTLAFLAPEQVQRSGLLDPQAVQRLIGDHMAGRRDYSLQLWSLLALETWYRMYIEDQAGDARDCRVSDLRGAPAAARALPAAAVAG
ncbi:MAG: asparagine synthase (glutamine-hydrolyzing) [Gammaproteobacteria bacterium]|nr:asparagine synthase (glutamine-hydrolyzing) [Gammaproteobacteria bacterium]